MPLRLWGRHQQPSPERRKMGKASRDKGKRGERELANILKEHGFEARRGQQFCGTSGDADVIGIPGIHIECKRVERLNISEAMNQSRRDAKETEIPTVFHRRNNEKWLVTMGLEDFLSILKGDQNEHS